MTTESILIVAAGAAVVIVALVAWRIRSTRRHDREVLRQMEPIMEDLSNPLRFLADLRSVWPDLDEDQRAEIENSSTYRDNHHRNLACEQMEKLDKLAGEIRALPNRRLRKSVQQFVRDWESEEPDELKVILAMVRRQTAA